MRIRRSADLRFRPEKFGGILYVPSRDDFFAIDRPGFAFVSSLSSVEWTDLEPGLRTPVERLAELEIVETQRPKVLARSYSGPSFIGTFVDIVTLETPLVLNCFSTAHCPLRCQYCHADDLMGIERRKKEENDEIGIANVIAVARRVPSIVAVITGGDPLTRPERATTLIENLSSDKALVLDTSGVAKKQVILDFIPTLVKHKVHVRVSLDFANPKSQEKIRPVNHLYETGLSSFHSPLFFIEECHRNGVPVTVQSVVSSHNDTPSALLKLRNFLIEREVRHWVLHLAVKAGLARKIEGKQEGRKRKRGILPNPKGARSSIWQIVKQTMVQDLPIDIRVTDNSNTPNSVLLLGADGVLHTEGLAHHGKVTLFDPEAGNPHQIESLFYYIDKFGHARRYLNWNPDMFDGDNLETRCVKACFSAPASVEDVVEREVKFRVRDRALIEKYLRMKRFRMTSNQILDDRYYDTPDRELEPNDFVVRVRIIDNKWRIALKGTRFRKKSGEYDRIEIEFDALSPQSVERMLRRRGLRVTWRFARRRITFSRRSGGAEIVIDELPVIGDCIEIEGDSVAIQNIVSEIPGLGEPETRNYKEMVNAWCVDRGVQFESIYGLGRRGLLRKRTAP